MHTHYCQNCSHLMEPQDRVEQFETGIGSFYACPKCYSMRLRDIENLELGKVELERNTLIQIPQLQNQ